MKATELSRLQEEIKLLQSSVHELSILKEIALDASSSDHVNDVLDSIIQKSVAAVKAEQ